MEEIARLEMAAGWDYTKTQPLVPPGSYEEDALLASIDQIRQEERAQLEDTFEARKRRQRRQLARSGRMI